MGFGSLQSRSQRAGRTMTSAVPDSETKTRELVLPGGEKEDAVVRGPFTFGGEDLGERMNGDGTAADGSMSLYAAAAAYKRRFEYMTSSPEATTIDSELSKWTARTSRCFERGFSRDYLLGLVSWLSLDWLGRKPGAGSSLPGLASGKPGLLFVDFRKKPNDTGGD